MRRSSIVLVDDDSSDGTADIARRTAAALGTAERLTVVTRQSVAVAAGPANSGP